MKFSYFITLIFISTAASGEFETLPYGPPSHYDALVAFQGEIIKKSSTSYYSIWGADPSLQKNYPSDVQILRCEADEDGELPSGFGRAFSQEGYHCVADIFPNAEPAYRVFGYFFHDGLQWQYYGPTGPSLYIPLDQYDDSDAGGRQSPKPGSVLYEGQPFGQENLSNPYEDILDEYKRLQY